MFCLIQHLMISWPFPASLTPVAWSSFHLFFLFAFAGGHLHHQYDNNILECIRDNIYKRDSDKHCHFHSHKHIQDCELNHFRHADVNSHVLHANHLHSAKAGCGIVYANQWKGNFAGFFVQFLVCFVPSFNLGGVAHQCRSWVSQKMCRQLSRPCWYLVSMTPRLSGKKQTNRPADRERMYQLGDIPSDWMWFNETPWNALVQTPDPEVCKGPAWKSPCKNLFPALWASTQEVT